VCVCVCVCVCVYVCMCVFVYVCRSIVLYRELKQEQPIEVKSEAMSYADARVTKLVMANLLGNPKLESKKRAELVQRMEVAYPDFPVKDINDMIIVVKQQNEVDKKRKVEARLQSNAHTMIWNDVLNSIIKIIKGHNETFLSNNSPYFMCFCLIL